MPDERKCTDCGAPLPANEPQPVCPACIFRRLANTGSTVYPPEDSAERGSAAHGTASSESLPLTDPRPKSSQATDFYSEYELLGEIGRGGMGVIYKAHQARLNRIVALKVIHATNAGGEAARRRFQSEVEVAARLNHPNIVPIFDTGEMDGWPCFSMEFFSGGNLAERINQFATQPDTGVRLLVKVARAVSFAHQHGVLHRDLKPANILLDNTGEPHVADFGLAKQLNSDSDLTRSGAVIGSPNYMSPEQAAGKSNSLTVATDIYSLGVMLYQMLTGRTPFLADTPFETMRLVVENEPQRPSTIVARADRDLETICLKCLEKEPTRRYRTADDFADDLERWLRHEPIHARPTTGIERGQKWVRRHPALAALSMLVVLAVAFGMAGVFWQWRKAELARRNEATERRRAEVALSRSALRLAESLLRSGDGQGAKVSLESVPVDLRDAGWSYLNTESDPSRLLPPIGIRKLDDLAAHPRQPSVFAAADHGDKIVLFNVRDGSRALEFEPGFPVAAERGRVLAARALLPTQALPPTNGGNLPPVPTQGGNPRAARISPTSELRVAFSKTGDRLAIGRTGPGGIVIHDAGNGRRLAAWDAPPSRRLEFSPDGTMLLQISADQKRLNMWNANDGTHRWRHEDADHAASFTADGQDVVSYCRNEQLRLVKASDGTAVTKLSNKYFEQFCLQPDGNLLVAGNPLGNVRGFDLDSGRPRFDFKPQENAIRYLAFLPGGDRYVLAADLPGHSFALQCWDLSGKPVRAVTGARGDIRIICVHPLSGELIVSAEEDRVWETTGVPPLSVLRSRHPHPSAAFWATDDTLFAPGADETGAALQSISDPNSPTVLWRAKGREHGELSISADRRRAAFGWYRSDRSIDVLERRGAEITQVASLKPSGPINYVRLSPNGDQLIAVERDSAHLEFFDVKTGAPAAALDVSDVWEFSDLAWLDRGKRLVGLVRTYSPQRAPVPITQVILWDATTGKQLVAVTNHWSSRFACAEPDGRRFAEGGGDSNVRIRDGRTLAVLREFRAHNAPITALAWHPTRPILATAAADFVIRLWNLEDGARLEELNGPLAPPSVLSFSPGGTRLATASRDGAARIWEPRCLAPK